MATPGRREKASVQHLEGQRLAADDLTWSTFLASPPTGRSWYPPGREKEEGENVRQKERRRKREGGEREQGTWRRKTREETEE